jgi:hypothetical protein
MRFVKSLFYDMIYMEGECHESNNRSKDL